MTYSSLMVHLDLGGSNDKLLHLTADMAERFGAGVIGITAHQPMQINYGEAYISAEFIDQDRALIEKQAAEAEDRFRSVLHGRVANLQWRSTIGYLELADWVANQARAADLLLMAQRPGESSMAANRGVDIGDLIMRIGRPMIVAPPSIERLDLEIVVIGWKDTRETRRAVLDALPLLRQTQRVIVAEIVELADDMSLARMRLLDVVTWLQGHGIRAELAAEQSGTGTDAARLDAISAEHRSGLLVMGAYGHSRLQEWVLGGMTRHALRHPAQCSFLSH